MRRQRLPAPPTAPPNASLFERRVADYLSYIERAMNAMPEFSLFSGNPNTSNQTAGQGSVGFDQNSGSTQLLWVNTLGTPSSWSTIHYG